MIDYSKFEHLLEVKGVTASEVSKAAKISRSALTDWKMGRYTPKLDKIQKIADYFGVSMSYFMDSNEDVDNAYYVNPETAKVAQDIFENKDLRILFDAAKDAKPEDLKMAADMLKRFKETNSDG
jgi:transcriptional regulator with XRE-family HTH domain